MRLQNDLAMWRGWSINKQTWVYGYLVYVGTTPLIVVDRTVHGRTFVRDYYPTRSPEPGVLYVRAEAVEPLSVGWFTGFYDGTEWPVFDGDYISYNVGPGISFYLVYYDLDHDKFRGKPVNPDDGYRDLENIMFGRDGSVIGSEFESLYLKKSNPWEDKEVNK